MIKLGLKLSGGNNSHLKSRFAFYGIDTSHFTGRAHNRGKKGNAPNIIHAEQLFVFNRNKGRREAGIRLKRALLESGVEEKCEQCGLGPAWNDKPITLQIDHKDGNVLNNLKDNLRFLCPNCHSQTETYGAKNIKN